MVLYRLHNVHLKQLLLEWDRGDKAKRTEILCTIHKLFVDNPTRSSDEILGHHAFPVCLRILSWLQLTYTLKDAQVTAMTAVLCDMLSRDDSSALMETFIQNGGVTVFTQLLCRENIHQSERSNIMRILVFLSRTGDFVTNLMCSENGPKWLTNCIEKVAVDEEETAIIMTLLTRLLRCQNQNIVWPLVDRLYDIITENTLQKASLFVGCKLLQSIVDEHHVFETAHPYLMRKLDDATTVEKLFLAFEHLTGDSEQVLEHLMDRLIVRRQYAQTLINATASMLKRSTDSLVAVPAQVCCKALKLSAEALEFHTRKDVQKARRQAFVDGIRSMLLRILPYACFCLTFPEVSKKKAVEAATFVRCLTDIMAVETAAVMEPTFGAELTAALRSDGEVEFCRQKDARSDFEEGRQFLLQKFPHLAYSRPQSTASSLVSADAV